MSPWAGGLSPRGRGNHRQYRRTPPPGGSIPARAGKPVPDTECLGRRRVYPRAGGETGVGRYSGRRVRGLSPRGRGNLPLIVLVPEIRGSIPARAGKPRKITGQTSFGRVYPRAGGETIGEVTPADYSEGLSPRGRGNPGSLRSDRRSVGSIPARAGKPPAQQQGTSEGRRSIPARAGKPAAPRTDTAARGVYPRAGGETCERPPPVPRAWGLSPRGRGNRGLLRRFHLGQRSIPARAGKPRIRSWRSRSRRVYPRAGGETSCQTFCASRSRGLSPRGRGNRLVAVSWRSYSRSIPARAGKPRRCWCRRCRCRVYPRAGGETITPPPFPVTPGGLSPRGRGNPIET